MEGYRMKNNVVFCLSLITASFSLYGSDQSMDDAGKVEIVLRAAKLFARSKRNRGSRNEWEKIVRKVDPKDQPGAVQNVSPRAIAFSSWVNIGPQELSHLGKDRV